MNMTFTVRLEFAIGEAVRVKYATWDNTAKAGSDFQHASSH
jgi:hypothetical protein